MNIELLRKIYQHLGDDISKEIFKNKIMQAITCDLKWAYENVKLADGGADYVKVLEEGTKAENMVIFGAGAWGKLYFLSTKERPWKCFIDNNPKEESYGGLSIIKVSEFLEVYNDEFVFICSLMHGNEMYNQLLKSGVPQNKVINVGKIVNDLMKKQYFDFEKLQLSMNKEIFLDVGACDGMTSVYLSKWNQNDLKVYVFEPDRYNQEKCIANLKDNNIDCIIVPKAAWSENTVLSFQEDGNSMSKICQEGDSSIDAVTIDSVVNNEVVTFIKMDIEGSELQALIGAERTIKENNPKLAICVYHKPEDIWEIPDIILKYNPEYKLYLRHYSLLNAETVLYAIVENNEI